MKTRTELYDLGGSLGQRIDFASQLIDWLVKVFRYYKESQWDYAKRKGSRKKIVKRLNPAHLEDLKIKFESPLKAEYYFTGYAILFEDWEELRNHVESIVEVVKRIVDELNVKEQSKRLNEILTAYNAV